MSNELQPYNGAIEESAMTPESIKKQVGLIQQVMRSVMQPKVHYDTIPGTDKPTLLQPGADKLNLTFRLSPEFTITESVREKDFIAYSVRCDLYHIPSGTRVAAGFGSCNSRETKYRYRSQNTGQLVPKEYWSDRDPEKLGGPQFSPRKKDGKWYIFEQIENDNPWDHDNTLLKMACKRAKVAATLNATAAHDIFTQDMEDMPSMNGVSEGHSAVSQPQEQARPQNGGQGSGQRQQSQNQGAQRSGGPTQKQIGAIRASCQKIDQDPHAVASYILDREVQSLNDLTGKEASDVIGAINKGNVPQSAPATEQMDETPF